jgi:CDP-glycerol glycerophosphotransferase (TagB/SpsB family)
VLLGRSISRVRRGSEPLVTVVVTATDAQSDFVDECLDSLRSQRYRTLQILVLGVGDAGPVREIVAGHMRSDWRVEWAGDRREQADARNHAARVARGRFMMFAEAGDTVPAAAVHDLVASLERTGSDLAMGLVGGHPARASQGSVRARVHSVDRPAVDASGFPFALSVGSVEGRLFRVDFWRAHGLRFTAPAPGMSPVVVDATTRARAFDVLSGVVYNALSRGHGLAFGHMPDRLPFLPVWRRGVEDQRAAVGRLSDEAAYDAWIVGLCADDLPIYVADSERMDAHTWSAFRDVWRSALDDRFSRIASALPVETRVLTWLVLNDHKVALERFLADRWFQTGYRTQLRGAEVYAELPFFGDPEIGVPDEFYRLDEADTPVRASLRRAVWQDETLHLELFAFIDHVDLRDQAPQTTVTLVERSAGHRIELQAEQFTDAAANRLSVDPFQDVSRSGLRAVVAAEQLTGAQPPASGSRHWALEVTVRVGQVARTGPVRHRDRRGSAGRLEPEVVAGRRIALVDGPSGVSVLVDLGVAGETTAAPPEGLMVAEAALADDVIVLRGHWRGPAPASARVRMVAGDQCVEASPRLADGAVRCVLPLSSDRWGRAALPLPTAPYRFLVVDDTRQAPVLIDPVLSAKLPVEERGRWHRARWTRAADDGLGVVLSAPLADDELGASAQNDLRSGYRTISEPVDRRLVYLQSYTGESATDSPRAIHEELVRQGRDLILHWGVADHSVPLPEQAVPVVIGTREWYDVLARAGYLVSNINFDRWLVKRPGQKVLQTFHGYPSKSMGLDLWRSKQFTPRRVAAELSRSRDQWDAIVVPIPEMAEHYRREYAYDGTIIDQGYPRDDVLVSDRAGSLRSRTRELLGIRAGQTAVLYAPTWRDDLATNFRKARAVEHLDLDAVTAALPDVVVLLRGHRFHAGGSTRPSGVLDVSAYPEVNELILAADVAVLDYSSLRFDFALTGKPMLFLVPDLLAYRDGVRGFLFSFEDSAPGPLLSTTAEVVEHLKDVPRLRAEWQQELTRFTSTYQYTEDGAASRRVVDAFFGGRIAGD